MTTFTASTPLIIANLNNLAHASYFYRLLTLGSLAVLAVSCAKDESITPQVDTIVQSSDVLATRYGNMAMGNPSGALASTTQYTNYLLVKPQFTMSYHRDRAIPN